jgi:hypothetical protein
MPTIPDQWKRNANDRIAHEMGDHRACDHAADHATALATAVRYLADGRRVQAKFYALVAIPTRDVADRDYLRTLDADTLIAIAKERA